MFVDAASGGVFGLKRIQGIKNSSGINLGTDAVSLRGQRIGKTGRTGVERADKNSKIVLDAKGVCISGQTEEK